VTTFTNQPGPSQHLRLQLGTDAVNRYHLVDSRRLAKPRGTPHSRQPIKQHSTNQSRCAICNTKDTDAVITSPQLNHAKLAFFPASFARAPGVKPTSPHHLAATDASGPATIARESTPTGFASVPLSAAATVYLTARMPAANSRMS